MACSGQYSALSFVHDSVAQPFIVAYALILPPPLPSSPFPPSVTSLCVFYRLKCIITEKKQHNVVVGHATKLVANDLK